MAFRGTVKDLLPTRGIDNSRGEQNIGDEFVYAAQNVRFRDLDFTQRGGYTKHVATAVVTAEPVVGLHQMTFKDATSRLIAVTKTKVKVESGGAWSDITGAITLSGTDNDLCSFAELNNLIVGTNNVDQLFKVTNTGNAAALGGTPPSRALCLLTYRNRMLAGNVTDNDGKSSVRWSIINNAENWTGAGSGTATPIIQSGQQVTGMGAVGQEAFLFYTDSIFRIIPQGDANNAFAFPEFATGVGCASPYSVVTVPDRGMLFFVGTRGVYMMQAPGYQPIRISKPIDGTWTTLNKTRINKVSATAYPDFNEVWFTVSVGAEATHSIILVYDYDRQTWTTFSGIAANYLANFRNGADVVGVIHGDYSGFVHDNQTGTSDNGTAITAFVTSKAYPLIDGRRRGCVRFANLAMAGQGINSNVAFNYGYDFQGLQLTEQVEQGIVGSVYDTALYDDATFAAENQLLVNINLTGQGSYYQFQLKQERLDDTFRCLGIQLGIVTEGTSGA